ncbi:DUF4912 domain-containing protein [Bacillus sp. DNRA2]|uniref:DUF4912 domain-containing protein n=1 Tax=Bacillus sp. DNRA2 TaxID=2723053 RepID=UPI00145EF9CF|nr:DUF4912 domain-containing protein [Bacillus sp. DNRA2]NMD71853.1 DUF4912 domain-containing protein [Bacillus sp. DNRA2]
MMTEDELSVTILTEEKITVAWRLSEQRMNFVASYFGKPYDSFRTALRIYDITDIDFNGNNAHLFHEFMMKKGQNDWKIKGLNANRHYCLEWGIHLSETEFFPLLRSVPFQTQFDSNVDLPVSKNPLNKQSNHALPQWSEHVSTYSYYETAALKGDGK